MTTSLHLNKNNREIVDKLNLNVSRYVNKKIEEEYLNIDFIKNEISLLKEKIINYESLLDEIVKERKNFTYEEIAYLEESKSVLTKYGLESRQIFTRFRSFIKKFNKKYINFEIFKELLK